MILPNDIVACFDNLKFLIERERGEYFGLLELQELEVICEKLKQEVKIQVALFPENSVVIAMATTLLLDEATERMEYTNAA